MEQRKLGDVDGLYVHKFLDAVAGKLASVAAFLDAAEGKARVGAHGFVDEDATALIRSAAMRSPRARSRVRTPPPSPNAEPLAAAIASSSSLTALMTPTGP